MATSRRRRRRRSRPMFATAPARGGGVRWLEPAGRRRRRRRLVPSGPVVFLAVLLLAGIGVGAYFYERHRSSERLAEAARAYAAAWTRRDTTAMYGLLTRAARRQYTAAEFRASYARADAAATVTRVRVGRLSAPRGGRIVAPVSVRTRLFGTLRGRVALPVVDENGHGRIGWTPALRLPGLRGSERVTQRVLAQPQRAQVFAADGRPLADEPAAASILGTPPAPGKPGTGLEGFYDARLAGRPGAQLRFGRRIVARVPVRRGRSVHTTIRPGLQRAALAALGARLGGVAVLRPRTGDVLALAGLAVSAPQPPGSTFKIITLSAALKAHVATPASSYPIRTYALLSGVRLRNASDEACGGSLPHAFAVSCNSVFAPLGARVGARRLVAAAQAFGFNEPVRVPAAKPSVISPPSRLKDDLAVGAAAIGQDRDLATPLEMASAGATIGNHGVRARPRIARSDPVQRHRAIPASVAAQVRSMMLGVVASGTGTAAQLPGIPVAGKTGTAELRPTAGGPPDPRNTDAWFVAFAPAYAPTIAVGVMLVGAGAGGQAAAPIARQVLQAALG